MKNRCRNSLLIGALPVLLLACGTYTSNRKVEVLPVETLTPDSASVVNVNVTFKVPARAFSGRSRLVVVPQLIQNDVMLSECSALVLDAPIYSKKMERKVCLDNYQDTLALQARKVNNKKELSIPYTESVTVPLDIDGGRIVAVLSSDGCGECGIVDTVNVAYIANIHTLIEPKKSLQVNWIEPEFVIRPKVLKGRGEALLQFVINRYDINLSLGDNESEMNEMLNTLQKITSDSLAVLNSVSIYGMASADGSFAFNTKLSENRAKSAKNWLVEQLNLSNEVYSRFNVGSRPEGWLPVLEAMRADGHKDTVKVEEILSKYNAENDDVAERYIRKLSCWSDIRSKYLQKDRKVEYEYTYTIRSFTTDEELLDMYGKRPDAFNEEELLRVSTLKKTTEEKKEVYRTILHYFPQSHVAANNLAVLLLREDKADEAEVVLNSLSDYTSETINTKAAVYVYQNDYEKAIELLESTEGLPEAKYNLGLLKASMRQLSEAYSLMKDYTDTNAAIVALSVNRNEEAMNMMNSNSDVTPKAEYVRGLIFARYDKADKMLIHLRNAVVEESLKKRAQTEADFIPYKENADFIDLVLKEGGVEE